MEMTASSQRAVILNHFNTLGTLATIYAREQYGIMSPASRILELRQEDYEIRTHWTNTEDSAGKKHREAKYVLISSPKRKAPDSDQTEEDLDNAVK